MRHLNSISTLLLGATMLLCSLIPPPVSAQSQEGDQLVSDLGVVSYTFRHQFAEDVPGTLDMISEMGFTHIEFSNLFGKSASELRTLLDERNLRATSYGVGHDALVENLDQVVENAKTLGAEHVRIAWFPHDAPFDIDDAQRAVEMFNETGQQLHERGLQFSYHNHGYEFRPHADGTLFDYMVQNTDPEYVSFEIDVFWVAHPGHDPVELLQAYPDRFKLVHLKDLKKGVEGDYSGSAPEGSDVPLGTGQIDFPAFLRAAQDSAIEYFYIEDESTDVVERVPKSRDYILSLTR